MSLHFSKIEEMPIEEMQSGLSVHAECGNIDFCIFIMYSFTMSILPRVGRTGSMKNNRYGGIQMQLELHYHDQKAVVDTHGAELVSYQDASGREYIWNGDPAYWTGRNPNLFPVVGNLKDGKVTIEGNEYEMGRHGFARNSEFTVTEQGEDYVVFELRENAQTLACYPYAFCFQIIHRLTADGFSTEYRVKNTGDKTLPYCVGAHTAFCCPMNEGEVFEDYRLVFEEAEEMPTLLLSDKGLFRNGDTEPMLSGTELELDYSVFARLDTIVFRGLKSNCVSLVHKDSRHGVSMGFEGFPMIAFWTKGAAKAPYICLEPWHGCAAYENESGDILDKPHVITLQPGEEKSLIYTVAVV